MILKRFIAYLIDILVVFVIFITLQNLLPKNNDIVNLNHELKEYQEKYLNKEISLKEYFDEFNYINYQIDKKNIIYSGIYFALVCLYFIIIPVLSKGKTLGLSIFKLRIEGENIIRLIIRNIITNGLLYMLLNTILVKALNYNLYLYIMTILALTQILLVIISSFMIIYKRDRMGLQDILSKTKIIEEV